MVRGELLRTEGGLGVAGWQPAKEGKRIASDIDNEKPAAKKNHLYNYVPLGGYGSGKG